MKLKSKLYSKKFAVLIAALIFSVAHASANIACFYFYNQPKMPEGLTKRNQE